jgi:hypothetical protein
MPPVLMAPWVPFFRRVSAQWLTCWNLEFDADSLGELELEHSCAEVSFMMPARERPALLRRLASQVLLI